MIPIDIHAFPDWLLRVVHVEPDRIPANAETWIDFKRLPEAGWGLAALIAVVAGAALFVFMYRREGGLPPVRRVLLPGLRIAAFLLAALMLCYPVLELSVERDQEAVTLVLVDNSLSFDTRDAYASDAELRKAVAAAVACAPDEVGDLSRAQVVQHLLERDDNLLLRGLAENNRLRVYTFSDSLREIGGSEKDAGQEIEDGSKESEPATEATRRPVPVVKTEDLRPRGTVTDIAAALRAAVETQGNTPVAGVVLITDGRWTDGEDPVAGAASYLAEREIPIHVLGIGDPAPTRNLRVMAVLAPERIFAGDPVAVDVRVAHRGFAGQSVGVELFDESVEESGASASLARAEVLLDDSTEVTSRFRVKLDRLGRRRLTARIAPRDGESFETDNERSVLVEVIKQVPRVLYVAGAPSNEFRMLRDMFRRDVRVHLATWLMSADPEAPQEGNTILSKLPTTPTELFEYDVLILHDINPRELPQGFIELAERFVGKHRGGLAYIAGEKYTSRVFRDTALGDLLPIEPDRTRADSEFGRGRFYQKAWPLVPTQEALFHSSTRLSSNPDRNREIWAELPGIYWSFPVARVKPGATVLLSHSNPALIVRERPRPLLAYQFYEGGRTAFLGVDESWRWRSVRGGQEVYERFWMQLLRTLVEGRLKGDRRKMIMTDREVYDLGDVMRLSAFVQDENYDPSTAQTVELRVLGEDGSEYAVELTQDEGQDGWFRGIYSPESVGAVEFKLDDASKVVRVEVPDLEFQDPRLDTSTLSDLATATNGSTAGVEDYQSIAKRIPDRRRRLVITDEPRPLWDNSLLMGMIVLILTIEWSVRKWSRLA
jgi:hypothetical protein